MLHKIIHGGGRTRLYQCWCGMRYRCLNPARPDYPRYGGRGITICEEWANDFLTFKNWALTHGYQEGLSIDRIDNEGNYEPSNCRWVTMKENMRNKRKNLHLIAWGENKLLVEWVNDPRCSVPYMILKGRLRLGWDPERAISTPVLTQGRKAS